MLLRMQPVTLADQPHSRARKALLFAALVSEMVTDTPKHKMWVMLILSVPLRARRPTTALTCTKLHAPDSLPYGPQPVCSCRATLNNTLMFITEAATLHKP
jgi:hypothetical protein